MSSRITHFFTKSLLFVPLFCSFVLLPPPRSVALFSVLPAFSLRYLPVHVSCHLHDTLLACFSHLRERRSSHTVLYTLTTSNQQEATHRSRSSRCSGPECLCSLQVSSPSLSCHYIGIRIAHPPHHNDVRIHNHLDAKPGGVRCGVRDALSEIPRVWEKEKEKEQERGQSTKLGRMTEHESAGHPTR